MQEFAASTGDSRIAFAFMYVTSWFVKSIMKIRTMDAAANSRYASESAIPETALIPILDDADRAMSAARRAERIRVPGMREYESGVSSLVLDV